MSTLQDALKQLEEARKILADATPEEDASQHLRKFQDARALLQETFSETKKEIEQSITKTKQVQEQLLKETNEIRRRCETLKTLTEQLPYFTKS